MIPKRTLFAAVVPALGLPLLSGCFAAETGVATAPPPPLPATTTVIVQAPSAPHRVLTYAEGRYEQRGDGSTTPYYWVWVPANTVAAPAPPPPTTIVIGPPVQRAVVYPSGRYEQRGDGVSVPYYWVWIPAGSSPPWPPHPTS